MADAVPNTQHEFWRPPAIASHAAEVEPLHEVVVVCPSCGSEFMVGAGFCHSCGSARPLADGSDRGWMRYLDVQKLKQKALVVGHELGLPLPSLIAFALGVVFLIAAFGVGLIYSVRDFSDFQAIQYWRMEWLMAAIAAFVAGILLKKSGSASQS
jgi:hypothetical protein